jgi:glycerol-1-phosphate dehydrogenase [NAD(P)+]
MKIAGEKNIINKLISGELVDPTSKRKIKPPVGKLIVEHNALEKIIKIFDEGKFARPNINVAIVSDYNTHEIAGAAIERALAKRYSVVSVILPEDVKADEESLKEVFCLSYGCKFIVAVGSGTINDLCKLASFRHGIEYGVFATAPSMNGYLSPTASIAFGDVKTSIKAHLPKMAIFDLDILCTAPERLILSGLGDVICRSTIQADSYISHKLLGTKHNEFIFDFLNAAETELLKEVKNLHKEDNSKAITTLVNALIAGGIAMWMSGTSEPASQGEHMLCHYMESFFENKMLNFHGEEVGVATLFMAKLQEKILSLDKLQLKPKKLTKKYFVELFGEEKAPKFYKEYKGKKLDAEIVEDINKVLKKNWQKLREEISEKSLGYRQIFNILKEAGAAIDIADLGWKEDDFKQACRNAYLTRNRFTFLDINEHKDI